MSLRVICELSNRYGADPDYVLAGGGNTSYKDEHFLYVKPSGVSLAAIREPDFVPMERAIIRRVFELGEFENNREREAAVTRLMAYAVTGGNGRRPSVEAPLHELMPFTYVVHLHPAAVNGMTCATQGEEACRRLFPQALWIPETDPGYILAKTVFEANREYTARHGESARMIFLQNHGVFVGGDTPEEIDRSYESIMTALGDAYQAAGVATTLQRTGSAPDPDTVFELAPPLRGWLGQPGQPVTVKALPPFRAATGPMTPDHIVYAKSFALKSEQPSPGEVEAFQQARGYLPLVVEVPGKAVFCAGATGRGAETVALLARDAALVEQLTQAFGGPRPLSDAGREFIENWEAESYRKQVSAGSGSRLTGKVAVVTGGAQGFGYGIAEELAAEGATVVIADLNQEGAATAAANLKAPGGAAAAAVNIADEESVAAMVRAVDAQYGGIDLLVANAGVLKAGSVKTMERRDWDFVTDVNYTGYFLCVKHVAGVMARQNAATGGWSDIVQVNSKSGLAGSNRNGAYAGSKFGTIGLTQSFALELVADGIKVNSVCPGNFFDGPLWSDPQRGLFVQYLESGKVPGAQTVEDVKRHYEKQIPMNRGCYPADVARAILYAVAQSYETGQAIPVTGGQVMLN